MFQDHTHFAKKKESKQIHSFLFALLTFSPQHSRLFRTHGCYKRQPVTVSEDTTTRPTGQVREDSWSMRQSKTKYAYDLAKQAVPKVFCVLEALEPGQLMWRADGVC